MDSATLRGCRPARIQRLAPVTEARTFELADGIASGMPTGGSDILIRVEPESERVTPAVWCEALRLPVVGSPEVIPDCSIGKKSPSAANARSPRPGGFKA